MMKSIVASAGLVASAYAFTQPTAQTYGSLLTPDLSSPLTTGQDYQITWQPKQPAEGVTVSLVLCNGPSTNCVLQGGAIVEGVPAAAGSYKWSVPCGVPEGVQNTATGYGMLVIVDGTGEFQYSTQFSVNKGESCAAPSSTTSSSMTTSASTTSSEVQSSPIHSISGRPSGYTDTTGGWYGWTSTMNTTTISSTASSKLITTSPAAVTSKAVVSSVESAVTSAYVKPTSSAPVVTTATSAKPSQYTGAASQQIVNLGLIGAAGLAVFAL